MTRYLSPEHLSPHPSTRRQPDALCCPSRAAAPERICWTPSQAAAFLQHNHAAYSNQLANAFEVLLRTAMRRGELLGTHWPEVHLTEQMPLARWNLTAIDNNHLHLGHPKTKASRNWLSLSARVVSALGRRATAARASLSEDAPLEWLAFCQSDGAPRRPQQLLVMLRRRSAEIGLPRL
ncbi:hypothetical protein ACFVXQ_05995, partial [Kitasatospora sp. NPDC058263]